MGDFRIKWGNFAEKMGDFMMKREISEKKTRDFRLNGGFPKRKGQAMYGQESPCHAWQRTESQRQALSYLALNRLANPR